jgi:hypothetical protein
MAYPGDMEDGAVDWRASPSLQRVRRPAVGPQQAPIKAPVSNTAIALLFASLLAGSFLTLVLLSPKENHFAPTLPVGVMAGMGR